MGLLKTTKLDNGMVGFECIYGGMEAPFGGIDASNTNPRYIDPRCFTDASNFLLINGELCSCFTSGLNIFPSLPWNPWPQNPTDSNPGILLGVGRIPTEGVVKNWALFVSPSADAGNLWHYRLFLWTNEFSGSSTQFFDCVVSGQTQTFAGKQATATITVTYNYPLTAEQTAPEQALQMTQGPSGPVNLTPPFAYQHNFFEICKFNLSLSGVPPPGTGQTAYNTNLYCDTYRTDFRTFVTPSGGAAAPVPTTQSIAAALANSWYGPNIASFPFTAAVNPGNPNEVILTARTSSGHPSVDGNAGNGMSIVGITNGWIFGFYSPTPGTAFYPVYPAPVSGGTGSEFVASPYPNVFNNVPSFQLTSTPFQGGKDSFQYGKTPIQQLTYETIGSSIFFGGWPANYMLRYDDDSGYFGISTQYEGARVLKKMAGHLISIGMIPGLDHNNQPNNFSDPHLWFSWSEEGNYNVWDSLDWTIPTAPVVTGAGGEQLADISDILTGLIISNSVAFILRAEGLSYATVQQNTTLPFDISHVALCKDGQGCASTALWTQFDQLGFYVGMTNVFMLQQAPQAIGDKIVCTLFPQLINMSNRMTDASPFSLVGNPSPFEDLYYNKVSVEPLTFTSNMRESTQFGVLIDSIVFMFSPIDGTWMKLDLNPVLPPETQSTLTWSIKKLVTLPLWSTIGYDGSYQTKQGMIYAQRFTGGKYQAPELYNLTPRFYSTGTQSAHIWFPAEEISFGRDITIDALYVLLAVAPGIEIDFQIDGWQRDQNGTPTFVIGAFTSKVISEISSIPGLYNEYQVFNIDGSAVTLKAPQLKINVNPQSSWTGYNPIVPYPVSSQPYIKIAKVAMFGSFDPNQRPV